MPRIRGIGCGLVFSGVYAVIHAGSVVDGSGIMGWALTGLVLVLSGAVLACWPKAKT
jgi:hypothetical protein